MSSAAITIVWFRQDLRIADNPALASAAAAGRVLPIYILDDIDAGDFSRGAASRVWLHHSLQQLDRSLDGRLQLFSGDASAILMRLVTELPVQGVFWNRCYEPWRRSRDAGIKQQLLRQGIKAQSFNASLLWEPWSVSKKDGSYYRVFTPFYQKGCQAAEPPRKPLAKATQIAYCENQTPSLTLAQLNLLPRQPWHRKLSDAWQIGEQAAAQRLDEFCVTNLGEYRHGRDFPALDSSSKLSPHLHFGEISPHQIWARFNDTMPADAAHFLREVAWREFSYYLLYHFPTLPQRNFNARFDEFAWLSDDDALAAWQAGKTGYPLIDAGLRELWQTGYMHNRVRMVVASFLVKNMMLHWRQGASWFWDCLLDADLASNSASWQWVAGSGADAAPYFRIFNPLLQSRKFDPDAAYLLRYCPELSGLSPRLRHQPWSADDSQLKAAGIRLGEHYPRPMLDIATTRQRALQAYKALR